MMRFLVFLLLMAPILAAGDWLLSHQGTVSVDWLDMTITASTALVAFALVAVCAAVTFMVLLLWQLAHWPERRRARRQARTLSRGIHYLTQGFTAFALGDEQAAAKALKKAMAALPNEPLPQLLNAQLLQRQGHHDQARGLLRGLLKHEATAQLATQTLIEQHKQRREWSEAITLAETAYKDTPRDRRAVLTLIDLYAHRGDTARMLELTEGMQFRSPLTRHERHRVSAIAHYLAAQAEEDSSRQLRHAQQAANYAPDFLPAVLAYVNQLETAEQHRRARKILRNAWREHPSSLLIAPILHHLEKTPAAKQSRLLRLFSTEPKRAAEYLLNARHALNRGQVEEAKPLLESALTLEESKQACLMMAEVEQELNGTQGANVWRARAMDAPAGERWVCGHCGHSQDSWQPHCAQCDSFDSLALQSKATTPLTSVAVPDVI